MEKNKVEHLPTSFHVAPRFEKYLLPNAVTPSNKIAGYDVIECRDGVEIGRHEFTTRQEAELFAQHEREFYLSYASRDGGPFPRWLEAIVLAFIFLATIGGVRALIYLVKNFCGS